MFLKTTSPLNDLDMITALFGINTKYVEKNNRRRNNDPENLCSIKKKVYLSVKVHDILI